MKRAGFGQRRRQHCERFEFSIENAMGAEVVLVLCTWLESSQDMVRGQPAAGHAALPTVIHVCSARGDARTPPDHILGIEEW